MSWSDVYPLDSPQYEELSSMSRSLHLGPAMACYGKQRLVSHKIVSKTVNLNVKVLWFAPTRPMHENNMYGNVSFTLDWKKAIEQLGPFLYYIDQQENGKFIYSRVLLTNKEYEFLTPVDEGGYRMPMKKYANKHYAATSCEDVKHVLEIGVETDCHREKWLYSNCKIQANDHSSANTLLYPGGPYNSCNCHRFNYFGNECPSPYKLQRTKKIIEKRCPAMLRDGSAGTYDSAAGYNDHKIVAYTATTSRRVTTQVEVAKQVPAVKKKTIRQIPASYQSSPTYASILRSSSPSALSSNEVANRTYGSPSSGVGYSSRAVSNSTDSFKTYGNSFSSFGHCGDSSSGYTSYSSGTYRSPSSSGLSYETPKKKDEGESWFAGALVAGGLALIAGLASFFGGRDKKK